jgi:hypothetical protein
MKSIEQLLEEVKKKFPDQGTRIELLFEHDPDFRALCRDYLICIQTLHKYKKLSAEEEQAVKDYESAMGDLEKDLSDFIFP